MRRTSGSSSLLTTTLALALLAGCSTGGDAENGTATIVVTDAANDELEQFEVDVSSITFTKVGGAVVSAFAKRTRVDFASLTDLSELFVGLSLEPGAYSGMEMTLDFSSASVWLTGQTTAATLVDASNAPLTGTLAVPVSFALGDRPNVAPLRNHLFVLDLDLDQALTVDSVNNRVTFTPVVSVEVDPTNPKPVAATGYLVSVDAATSSFVVEKRAVDGTALGTYTVRVTTPTVFQINGVVTAGAAGLAQLAALPLGSRVFAQGTVSAAQRLLLAAAVESGAGVPFNGQDWVEGLVVGRDNAAGVDATLTVLGRSRVDASGTRTFNTLHTVAVSYANTKVLRRWASNTLNANSLNVGQRVLAFGTLVGTSLDATATTGVVRMLPTDVYGLALSAPTGGTMTLSLVRIGLRPISEFDFGVGGVPQSDPSNFTVDVSGLSTSGIENGSKVCARGWVNPVDVIGDQDWRAIGVVNRTNTLQLLLGAWVPSSQTAIVSATSTAVTLNVTEALIKTVEDGFGSTPLTDTPMPMVRPLLGVGVYRIVEGGAVQVHYGFASFATALEARRQAGARMVRIAALGTHSGASQLFDGLVVTVVLQ